MITVTHKRDSGGNQFATTYHSDFRLYGFAASLYAIGQSKPNYPMPVTNAVAETMIWADRGAFDVAAVWHIKSLRED